MVTTKTELDSQRLWTRQRLVSNFSTLVPGEVSAPRTATRLEMFTDFYKTQIFISGTLI